MQLLPFFARVLPAAHSDHEGAEKDSERDYDFESVVHFAFGLVQGKAARKQLFTALHYRITY
ncbi:MAG: hypothetical protein E6Q97_22850 [Desulfurellales bacterium]|nr:MAG: hypothetical protein E6Q97_22850 [Desulfurellales bacterium]